MARLARNRVWKGKKSSGPIGVQVRRDTTPQYFARVEIDGPSEILYDEKRKTFDGHALRLKTKAPIYCYDMDGNLVLEAE